MPMVNNIHVYRDTGPGTVVLVAQNAQGLRTLGYSYMAVTGGAHQAGQQIAVNGQYRICEGAYVAVGNAGVVKTCSRIGVNGFNPEADFT